MGRGLSLSPPTAAAPISYLPLLPACHACPYNQTTIHGWPRWPKRVMPASLPLPLPQRARPAKGGALLPPPPVSSLSLVLVLLADILVLLFKYRRISRLRLQSYLQYGGFAKSYYSVLFTVTFFITGTFLFIGTFRSAGTIYLLPHGRVLQPIRLNNPLTQPDIG